MFSIYKDLPLCIPEISSFYLRTNKNLTAQCTAARLHQETRSLHSPLSLLYRPELPSAALAADTWASVSVSYAGRERTLILSISRLASPFQLTKYLAIELSTIYMGNRESAYCILQAVENWMWHGLDVNKQKQHVKVFKETSNEQCYWLHHCCIHVCVCDSWLSVKD